MRIVIRNKRNQELVTSPLSGLPNTFGNFLCLVIHCLTIFDALIQRVLIVLFQKFQLAIYGRYIVML